MDSSFDSEDEEPLSKKFRPDPSEAEVKGSSLKGKGLALKGKGPAWKGKSKASKVKAKPSEKESDDSSSEDSAKEEETKKGRRRVSIQLVTESSEAGRLPEVPDPELEVSSTSKGSVKVKSGGYQGKKFTVSCENLIMSEYGSLS
jgi:hypothetical protein